MQSGTVIAGRLLLRRQLGQGAMGTVWVAHDQELDAEVAVKFLGTGGEANPAALARFKREAQASAKIASPHVVKVFHHGVTPEGVPFIEMELLTGEDLDSLLHRSLTQRQRPLPPDFVRTLVTQAARGLGAAHKQGIVHRDIKPSNIFVSDPEGEPNVSLSLDRGEVFVRLLDFGIAKQIRSSDPQLTGTGQALGTPFTMSPEQVTNSRVVDHRTDLWSLAVVAYYAITGSWPFHGDTIGEIFIRIHEARFTPPSQAWPELPASLDAWFLRALARDPAARFGSARELAETFAQALDSRPRAIPTPTPVPPPRPPTAGDPPPKDTTRPSGTAGGTASPVSSDRTARKAEAKGAGSFGWLALLGGAGLLIAGVSLVGWWRVAGHETQATSAQSPLGASAAPGLITAATQSAAIGSVVPPAFGGGVPNIDVRPAPSGATASGASGHAAASGSAPLEPRPSVVPPVPHQAWSPRPPGARPPTTPGTGRATTPAPTNHSRPSATAPGRRSTGLLPPEF